MKNTNKYNYYITLINMCNSLDDKENILKSKGHSGNYKSIEAVIDELENKTLIF